MRIHASILSVETSYVAPVSIDPSPERGWRVLLTAGTLGAIAAVMAGCSAAQSQSEPPIAGKEFFNMSLSSGSTQGSASSPLPASSGLYQFDSFYYVCQDLYSYNNLQLNVVSGPDKGLLLGLPLIGASTQMGGGTLKFWLQPMDQVQLVIYGPAPPNNLVPPSCTMYLYGEVVYGTLQTLQ
jgi:hypothetical protein